MKRIAWQCVNKEELTMKFMKKIMAAVAASAVAAVSVVGASLSAYALQPATSAPYTVYMLSLIHI